MIQLEGENNFILPTSMEAVREWEYQKMDHWYMDDLFVFTWQRILIPRAQEVFDQMVIYEDYDWEPENYVRVFSLGSMSREVWGVPTGWEFDLPPLPSP